MVGDEDETPEVSEEPSHAWMLTFADLVSLMLTFFVLLYSMSSLQSDEFETLASVLSQRLNPSRDLVKESPTADLNLPTVSVPRAASLYYIQHVLRTKFEDDPTLGTLSIKRTDSELIISLPSDALFAPASATLTPAADRILSTLADALRYFTNEVSVAGHTDPNPINTPEFPSNWELSLARRRRLLGHFAMAATLSRSRFSAMPPPGSRNSISIFPLTSVSARRVGWK